MEEAKTAISNLTFAVGQGEILGLLGHNGAGKTTTMKIITAEECADGGQVSAANLLLGAHVLTTSSLITYNLRKKLSSCYLRINCTFDSNIIL